MNLKIGLFMRMRGKEANLECPHVSFVQSESVYAGSDFVCVRLSDTGLTRCLVYLIRSKDYPKKCKVYDKKSS